MYKRTVVF